MVSSPMYDRLMTFAAQADYNAELQSWDSEHKRVIDGFDEAIERVRHFQEHQGFTGKTGEALKAWADQTVARLEAKRSYYMGGIARYVAARQTIAQAAADARRLSPTLIDSKTAAMRDAAKVALYACDWCFDGSGAWSYREHSVVDGSRLCRWCGGAGERHA